MAMLKAGADIGDMTPAQIVKNDSKEFQIRQLSNAHQPVIRYGYRPSNGYAR